VPISLHCVCSGIAIADNLTGYSSVIKQTTAQVYTINRQAS